MYDERVRTRYLRSLSVWDAGTFAEPGFDDRSITSLTRTGSRNMHLCLCPSVLAVQPIAIHPTMPTFVHWLHNRNTVGLILLDKIM